MKKNLFMALACAAVAFSGNAQLRVLESGNVQLGSIENAEANTLADPSAQLNIYGDGARGSKGYMTFGDGKYVGIGEYGSTNTNILHLFGSAGIYYTIGTSPIFAFINTNVNKNFIFGCDVTASAFLVNSDSRLKSRVESIVGFGSALSAITPVSYTLAALPPLTTSTVNDIADKATSGSEEKLTALTPSDRTRFGFIAQEVKEILPELVTEDENGYLSIDYIGFIPVLVDAYKNLEAKVKEQEEMISTLVTGEGMRKSASGVKGVTESKAVLMQNRPNPFRDTTSITCNVPDGSEEAFIYIYDLQGKQLMRKTIEERGACTITVDALTLQPGMYIYTLVIDGFEIDSKKMILTD